MKRSKIIIFCPGANATGGTELLHQLGYKLNLLGFDASIFYYGYEEGQEAVHPHFLKYHVPVAEAIEDSKEKLYVYPEAIAHSIEGIKKDLPNSAHVMWWLSVDNAGMTPELEKKFTADDSLTHLVQSYYADDYVKTVLAIPDERRFYLSDYINNNFLNMSNTDQRDNIVLFNPRKGFDRTAAIIKSSDHRIKWQAIAGLSPDKVPQLLQTAKVYIDFGNHPGKDRFPREAVACGCRIITGRRGAAANSRDIPIIDQLKISDDADNGYILTLIYTLLENYKHNGNLYDAYREMINEEFHTFESDTLTVFSKLMECPIDDWEKDAREMKEQILEAVSNEDYKTAFYRLTVYRAKRFEADKDIIILEAYMRLGISEEQVALYLVNRLLKEDPENYEAYIIKARALMALGKPGAYEALDNAANYSEGTSDEEYVRSVVKELDTRTSRLAICVPTVGHDEAIEEVMNYSIDYLNRNDIDVYYYDSSENDKVKTIVENLNRKGYHNVYHIKVSPGMSFGSKIDMMFSGHGFVKDYDYIWPIKDRVICNENMLRLVLEKCDGRTDLIVTLSLGDMFENGYRDIDSPQQLYTMFAKQITSLETAVYNRRSFLGDYSPGSVKTAPKYQDEFWHYWVVFNKLSKMKDPLISVISKDGAYNMVSSVTQDSDWSKRVFEVWIDEWVQLNFELPDIYSPYKTKAVKETTSINELLGKRETFEKLHEKGILTAEAFEGYAGVWESVTTVPVEDIKNIAYGRS